MDLYSAIYMAANRMGMNLPDLTGSRDEVLRDFLFKLTDAWVEGMFFGIQFQLLGGHQQTSDDTQ